MSGDEDDIKTADTVIEAMRFMRRDGMRTVLETLYRRLGLMMADQIDKIDPYTMRQVLTVIEQIDKEIEEENK